jgi:hypothetical protein
MTQRCLVTRRAWIAVTIFVLCAAPAGAQKLFEARVGVFDNASPTSASPSFSSSTGTNKLREVPDIIDESALDDLFSGVTDFNPLFDGLAVGYDLRGLPAIVEWDPAIGGQGALSVIVPGVIERGQLTFSAGSFEEDLEAFEEWLKGNVDGPNSPQNLLTDLLQALVASSPVEPVAGNPNSMMTRMTGHDFMLGGEGPFIHSDGRIPDAPDQTGLGLYAGYASAGPYDQELLELPFDHRFNLRSAPNWSILLSIPITATFTEGQWTAMGSLGLGFQYRPFDWWALTPMFRVGAVGSLDVGAAALLYSGTLTSDIHFDLARASNGLSGITLGITNQAGFSETVDGITIGDFNLDYDLTNGVFRNGGYLRGAFGKGAWGWKFYGNDTRWAGSELFLDSSAEIGVALLRIGSVGSKWPYESLNLSAGYVGDFDQWNGVTIGLRGRF